MNSIRSRKDTKKNLATNKEGSRRASFKSEDNHKTYVLEFLKVVFSRSEVGFKLWDNMYRFVDPG